MSVLNVELLSLRRRRVKPLPGDVPGVRARVVFGKHSPERSCGQLGGHLPHSAFRVMAEQIKVLVWVVVEWRHQTVFFGVYPLKSSSQRLNRTGHCAVGVGQVVDLVALALAVHRLEVVLHALEVQSVVLGPVPSPARGGLGGVNVQPRDVHPAVPFRTLGVVVAVHLDAGVRLPEVGPDQPL